jgi:hypothetical protein
MSRNGDGNYFMMEVESVIPVEYSVTASSINEAKRLFRAATNRMLSIGEWNRWCSGLSVIFKLVDQTGRIINRKARTHDLLRIDGAGGGSDNSLEVSRLISFKKPSGKAESIAIELKSGQDQAEELFEIKRYNNVVTAIVHESTKPEVSKKLSFVSPLEWSTLLKRLVSRELPENA